MLVTGATGLAALLLLSGCGFGGKKHGDASPEPTQSASETVSPTATPVDDANDPILPKSCNELLSRLAVNTALGQHFTGEGDFLNAAPLPSIGRTGRVTCGYGVTTDAAGKKSSMVEASYITYKDSETASARLDLTVANDQKAGATVTDVEVAGQPAFVLTSEQASVLVMAETSHTYVVHVDASLIAAGSTAPLVAIATTMVQNMADLRSR
jgi:hypothetical protein